MKINTEFINGLKKSLTNKDVSEFKKYLTILIQNNFVCENFIPDHTIRKKDFISVLALAVNYHNLAAVQEILPHYKACDFSDLCCRRAIQIAAKKHDHIMVEFLLQNIKGFNAGLNNGYSAVKQALKAKPHPGNQTVLLLFAQAMTGTTVSINAGNLNNKNHFVQQLKNKYRLV